MDKLYALIPKDKLLHIAVGLLVALLTVVEQRIAGAIAAQFMAAHPMAVPAMLSVLNVGLAKEGCDRLDNLLMYAMGRPPIHGVDAWDVVATVCGGELLIGALLWVGWI